MEEKKVTFEEKLTQLLESVSYTHLTLPTILRVQISVVAVSLKKFFQAEDGIRDAQESRGLGDVYKRQEGHWESVCDEVWLVFIPEEEQVRRAMKRSGITRKEVLMRIRRQMPLVEKRKMADVIIDNSQTLEALYEQVGQALMKALERASTMENEKFS